MASDWLFAPAELLASPSLRSGMTPRDELLLRRKACDFIEKLAKVLDLPKLAQNSACNYLHRFYMRQAFQCFDKYVVAAACVLLAAKVEEVPKKLVAIAREYIAVRRELEKTEVFAFQKHDPQAIATRIAAMEGLVLQTLCYDVTIAHPYKFINEQVDRVVRVVEASTNEVDAKVLSGKIKQVAWSFLNDSAYTCACLRMEPSELATGAVYLAGLYESAIPNDLQTPEGALWWEVLATPFAILQDAATCLLAAYTDPYIDTQRLPTRLAELVYQFHPPRAVVSVESPNCLLDASSTLTDTSLRSASPLDAGMCVTSPECGSSQGRSPFDHEFESDIKSPLAVDQRDVVELKATRPLLSKKRRSEPEEEFTGRRVKTHW